MRRFLRGFMRLLGKRSCEEVVEALCEYADGTLDPKLKEILERHFADCPDCRAFAAQYREVIRLGGELAGDEIPEEVVSRVHRALKEHSKVKP